MRTSSKRVFRPTRVPVLLAAASALLCACADVPPAADDALDAPSEQGGVELEKPLHKFTIALGEGHDVTYRAYADGAVLIGERSLRERDAVLTKSTSAAASGPLALFESVHPGRAVPDALRKLQAFLDTAQPRSAGEPLAAFAAPGAERAGVIAKASADGQSFKDAFGCFFGSDDAYNVCFLNSGGDTNAYASTRWAVYKVAPYDQGLRFTTSINGAPRLAMPIGEGGFWVQLQAGPLRADGGRVYPDVVNHRVDVTGSGGYHFSARFHDYKTANANCAEAWSWDRSYEPLKGGATMHACTSHYGVL
ncbi:MAG: hypothetical protein ABW252_03455 [Polyangiales bacterium]